MKFIRLKYRVNQIWYFELCVKYSLSYNYHYYYRLITKKLSSGIMYRLKLLSLFNTRIFFRKYTLFENKILLPETILEYFNVITYSFLSIRYVKNNLGKIKNEN